MKTSLNNTRLNFSSRIGLWTALGAVAATGLVSSCSDDADDDSVSAGAAGSNIAGSGNMAGNGMGGASMAGGGMGGASMAGGGMGGSAMTGDGPTGVIEVLSADPVLASDNSTTVAIRGQVVFAPLAQFGNLGGTPDPFQVVSVPLAGGELGDSIALPDGYHPEGIAAADDGTLYVGSLVTGGIQRVPADSTTAEEFIAGQTVAERGVVGLTVDDDRNLLWFCDSNPTAPGPVAALVGVSTAPATEGQEMARHELPTATATDADAGAPDAFCNDVIVTPAGDLLITESRGGSIFRVPSADVMTANSASLWSQAPELANPAGFGVNGLEMVGDMLVVANGGLFVIDPSAPQSATEITLTGADPLFLNGPDGLALVPGSTTELVVADNGGRIIKVTLDLE